MQEPLIRLQVLQWYSWTFKLHVILNDALVRSVDGDPITTV